MMKAGDRFRGMTVESVRKGNFTALFHCGNGVLLRYTLSEIPDLLHKHEFLVFTGEHNTETDGKFYEATVNVAGFWK